MEADGLSRRPVPRRDDIVQREVGLRQDDLPRQAAARCRAFGVPGPVAERVAIAQVGAAVELDDSEIVRRIDFHQLRHVADAAARSSRKPGEGVAEAEDVSGDTQRHVARRVGGDGGLKGDHDRWGGGHRQDGGRLALGGDDGPLLRGEVSAAWAEGHQGMQAGRQVIDAEPALTVAEGRPAADADQDVRQGRAGGGIGQRPDDPTRRQVLRRVDPGGDDVVDLRCAVDQRQARDDRIAARIPFDGWVGGGARVAIVQHAP